jgi:hypothetical protein
MDVMIDRERNTRRRPGAWSLAGLALVLLAVQAVASDVLPAGSLWTRVTPSVVWCEDRSSTVTIEVHLVGLENVASVRIVGGNESYPLHDDGTHGDEVAGDGVFTSSGIRPYCSTLFSLKFDRDFATWYGSVEVTLDDGRALEDPGWVSVGLVNPRYRQRSDVVDLGDGVTMTGNTLFLEDPHLQVFDGYPVYSTSIDEAVQAACRRLYALLPDAFDFVVLMPGMQVFSASNLEAFDATVIRVSNDVEGIGLAQFDRTAEYGSAGRLQAAVVHSFGSVDLVDQELIQRWGAALGESLGLTEETEDGTLLWSSLSDIGGQLAAYYISDTGVIGTFSDNGDGTWTLVPATGTEAYSPLELYIMGLIPAEDVPPIHVLVDPDVSDPQRVTAREVRTVTMDDIVATVGERVPPASEPAEFDVALVVVQDEPFTDAEYAFFTLLSTELTYSGAPVNFDLYAPFFWATGQRGTLKTELPLPL